MAGFSSQSGIEDAAHAHLLLEIGRVELERHEIALLDADPVLAGEAAADLDAELEDFLAHEFGLFHLARLVGVEHHQRMQIAVARMEHVGDAEPLRFGDLVDALQHIGQLAGRDRAVHADVIGHAARGAEGGFAALPDRGALGFRLRDLDGLRVERLGDGDDAAEHVVDFLVGSLDLDDQHRLDVERIACMGEGLADLDRRAVHIFKRHRNDAGGDDRRDAGARIVHALEAEQRRARAFGRAQDAHRRFGDDAELAFRPGDQAEQVVAAAIEVLAAECPRPCRRAAPG